MKIVKTIGPYSPYQHFEDDCNPLFEHLGSFSRITLVIEFDSWEERQEILDWCLDPENTNSGFGGTEPLDYKYDMSRKEWHFDNEGAFLAFRLRWSS